MDENEKRAEPRSPILSYADLYSSGRSLGQARVVDISPNGLGASAHAGLRPGQRLSVAIAGVGRIKARVQWVAGWRFGLRFERAIAVEDIDLSGTMASGAGRAYG